MLRAHTSLTFTQKILAPTTRFFPPLPGRRNTLPKTPGRRRAYGREAEEGAVGVGVSFHPTQHQ